jgi:hypothetical protein
VGFVAAALGSVQEFPQVGTAAAAAAQLMFSMMASCVAMMLT